MLSKGELSEVVGRKVQLQLQEYTLVGPMLGSFIASLSVRYRLSRAKIQEFLLDWVDVELSIGTIDRSIREAGLACRPVVEDLIEQLHYGTRTEEGTSAYEALLSVIETCRLRDFNPWTYLGEVIATRRKGMSAPLIPQTLPVATSSPV